MFLEKQEPVTGETFTWFDDVGNPLDLQDSNILLDLSTINEYKVEINHNQKKEVPQFLFLIAEMKLKI